ncbi:MAG: GntR family transcriptional regulator [Planctomycetota bacterium]
MRANTQPPNTQPPSTQPLSTQPPSTQQLSTQLLRADRRPLAHQLRDRLVQFFAERDLQPGARLPTEAEIATTFGVGRSTARESLRLLEQEGVVRAARGVGRFLTGRAQLDRPLTALEGVSEMAAQQGLRIRNTVVALTLEDLDAQRRKRLGMARDERAVRLERARYRGKELLVYSIDVFPASLVPDPLQADWTHSLFQVFEASGHRLDSALCDVQASHLPRAAARLFEIRASEPWLRLLQEHRTADGVPRLLSDDYHRGSRFSFSLIRSR